MWNENICDSEQARTFFWVVPSKISSEGHVKMNERSELSVELNVIFFIQVLKEQRFYRTLYSVPRKLSSYICVFFALARLIELKQGIEHRTKLFRHIHRRITGEKKLSISTRMEGNRVIFEENLFSWRWWLIASAVGNRAEPHSPLRDMR